MNRSSTTDKQSITAKTRIGYLLATGLGAGLMPVAPGTAGAVEGVAIFLAVQAFHLQREYFFLAMVIMNVVLFAVGVWASNSACRLTGLEDPQVAVIDEVSGQLIALTPLALLPSFSLTALVIGFLLFRLFDIFKPYPIRKLERLHGGLGVMADDALAGVYAAVLIWSGHLLRLV